MSRLPSTPSKAYDLRKKFLMSVLKKMCVVSKIENIVKTFICAEKNVRYIKCMLYQMYAKLRFNLQS